jgi:hypothetical protein
MVMIRVFFLYKILVFQNYRYLNDKYCAISSILFQPNGQDGR